MKAKKLAKTFAVPQDRDEADRAVAELGRVRREIVRAETVMNDEIAAVRERHENYAAPMQARAAGLLDGLEAFAAANRMALTAGNRQKFAQLPSGVLRWRTRPPRVTVRLPEAAIAALKALGLSRFVRVKEEVNREAILNEPEAVAGVTGISVASAGEDFVVEPHEAELAPGASEAAR